MVLIVLAFVYRGSGDTQNVESGIVVAPVAPRAYQDTKDGDGDGIADWEEELAGTDPLVPNERKPSPTPEEKETVDDLPDTLTTRFSLQFMGNYIAQNAGDQSMTDDQKAKFVGEMAEAAKLVVEDKPYTNIDIKIEGKTDTASIRAYGNALGAVMNRYPHPGGDEVAITSEAVQKNDPARLAPLAPIIDAYALTIRDMKALPVPLPMANEHLALLNALQTVHNDIVAMQKVFDDPLPALIRVQSYTETSLKALVESVQNVRIALELNGISYSEGEPGMLFFKI